MSDYDVLPAGVIGTTVTPVRDDGSVDLAALAGIVDDLASHCQVVSVFGAEVTEYSMMGATERREALRAAIAMADGRVPVLAGASSARVAEVAELSAVAKEAGASAVQVLIPLRPGGDAASAEELVGYFTAVAAASALPVVAYHNPGRGTDASAPALEAISAVPGVCGFKESSRDLTKIARLCASIDLAGTARYYTTMQPLLATLQYGGSGAMAPVTGALLCSVVYEHFAAGRLAEAAEAQRVFSAYPGRWGRFGLTAVSKASLEVRGLQPGAPVGSFATVDEAAKREIADHLRSFGVPVA